ncbi:hypothetical protein BGW36DRAFT_422928 [Talaromyces proteolyticus]|uniref:Uncharacterized protein n=1 Tax=Talaromyces proteolyticus TaxID=1131652 RepID=A0AAD4L0Q3_9EURO|nr:uncharacterized protein BGW36DRAFT_422928 [Talaromyces proteolyticus]KAH8703365.1 hypothetical protein BGW36DRAFT_422928 [Talaromyces proteolyticus]
MSKYEITFVTPSKQDKGIFKPTFRQAYPNLPIRITVPKFSGYTLPLKPQIVISQFIAKVQYGAGCMADHELFDNIGLSTDVDSEGFREIKGSRLNTWIVFKDLNVKFINKNNINLYGNVSMKKIDISDRGGLLVKAWTPKTGIVEIKDVVFQVLGVYKIAFELEFDDGQKIGWTPWQGVEVQVKKNSQINVPICMAGRYEWVNE